MCKTNLKSIHLLQNLLFHHTYKQNACGSKVTKYVIKNIKGIENYKKKKGDVRKSYDKTTLLDNNPT